MTNDIKKAIWYNIIDKKNERKVAFYETKGN